MSISLEFDTFGSDPVRSYMSLSRHRSSDARGVLLIYGMFSNQLFEVLYELVFSGNLALPLVGRRRHFSTIIHGEIERFLGMTRYIIGYGYFRLREPWEANPTNRRGVIGELDQGRAILSLGDNIFLFNFDMPLHPHQLPLYPLPDGIFLERIET
ncbi:hypothetical protein F3Y22_tig00111000pilonHSYRG00238 [Hibiscus syriacus]|uniref:Uncharacterized protein n=1 Tax=Hibiscus syriacus TaxID=106335 RepID=A0A6A2Z836_HIBSY|nr:hypothetical protein F3Y22_tig00111000pilonHSYRG00238 [Hibiscus syriacus]